MSPLRFNDEGVGFEDEARTIIDHLTRGPETLEIVSIVGMPGAGKTFLAERIYNDFHIRHHFHLSAWAVVSQEYELRNLLLSILTTISNISSYIYEMDDEDLCVKVRQSLLRKRYLLVLDDVWDSGVWNEIKWVLPDDKNGSRILLTTRYRNLGLDANAYFLRPLTFDESFKLLKHKLFPMEDFPPHLSEIGIRIVEDCRGLPLSLVAIAGVLATIGNEVDKWKQVAETLNTRNYNENFVILEMSYRHLPYHLKLAYLYSSGISRDNVIPVQKLIWLWIAEGLVEKTEEVKSLEDLAEDYLNDLIDRSLLMVTKRKSNGRVKECRVHDLLLEFCKTKAKEINCLDVIHGHQEIASFVASSRHRHRLCISSEWQHFIERKSWSPYLRSLLFFSTNKTQKTQSYDVSSVCYDFKLLTVLDLGCINMGNAFPSRIELLLHLRFLAVKGEVNVLPSYIGNFQSLETLIIEGLGGEIFLPETIWELEMLRHLHISPRVAFGLQEYKNGNRHLANLSTFSTPALPHGKCMEKIMRRLPNIRKLKCIFLESLDYLWFPIFDFLSQLESLKVSYLGVTPYSCKLDFPLNLKELTLSKFRLPWNEISVIGRLPNLEVLKLLTQSFDGQQWNMKDGEFLKLRFLKLAELNIVRWNAFYDHLPVLQHLVLEKCEQLQEIPADFGDSTSLDKIEVQYCSDSAVISAEKILEEQLEMGNEMLKVLIYP